MGTRRVTRTPREAVESPGVPRRRHKTIDLTWEATKETIQAKAEIERMGIEFAPRPDGESPVLPADPTLLSDSQLVELMGSFVGWADYSATQLGFAEVDDRAAQSLLDRKRDILMLKNRPSAEALRKGEERITLIKAEIEADPEVIDLVQAQAVTYARRKLLLTTFERYERDGAFLSRELTRRTEGQTPQQRRTSRWTT